jgi:hypothetical protein
MRECIAGNDRVTILAVSAFVSHVARRKTTEIRIRVAPLKPNEAQQQARGRQDEQQTRRAEDDRGNTADNRERERLEDGAPQRNAPKDGP